MNLAKGYLTFTMALVAVATGIYFAGWTDQKQEGVLMIWAGLTAFGLRRALQ